MAKTLYRRRFIPMETVELKDDQILSYGEDCIITRWKVLKPRTDLGGGISAYFLKEGLKVSKFFTPNGDFLYWYCDMIQTIQTEDSIIFEDLLIDVVITPDSRVHVVDAAEAADALRDGLITPEMLCRSLRSMDMLLQKIENGSFKEYTDLVEKYE